MLLPTAAPGTGSPLHRAEGNGPTGSNNLALNPLVKLEKPSAPD